MIVTLLDRFNTSDSLIVVVYMLSMIFIRSMEMSSLPSSLSSSLSSMKVTTFQILNALLLINLLSSSSYTLSLYTFLLFMTILSIVFYPYLAKTSNYYTATITTSSNNNTSQRSIYDKLVVTSFSYGIVGILAIYYNEPIFGIMLVFTSFCSASYHYHYEGMYFNADNIVATSIGVIYIRTLIISFMYYHEYEMLCIGGTLGLFLAAFLLVYCGMPAIIYEANGCCVRGSNPVYALVHALWHIVSGAGPLFSLIIIHTMKTNGRFSISSILGSEYYIFNMLPLWPTISILIGIIVNVTGNVIGIMPVQ